MNKQPVNISETFRNKCREANLKITPQRMIIFESLIDDRGHPSADIVFQRVRKKIPNISFDTVNRTLLSFVKIGLLKVVEGGGDARRFDPHLEQHHHLRCIKCFRVIDFKSKDYDAIKVPAKYLHGFKLVSKKVVLEGICQKCRQESLT